MTLVLLPGMDGTGTLFASLLRELSPSIKTQVIAYPRDKCLGYGELVSYAQAQMPPEGDVVVLGESFSGPIAIETAARGGARVRGLILACSFASTPRPVLAPLRHAAHLLPSPCAVRILLVQALMGRDATPELTNALGAALSCVEPRVMRHRVAAALAVNATKTLAGIRGPVLYLQALHDRVIPARCATVVQRACPQAQVERMSGPHFLLQARPAETARVIESFVRRVQRAAP